MRQLLKLSWFCTCTVAAFAAALVAPAQELTSATSRTQVVKRLPRVSGTDQSPANLTKETLYDAWRISQMADQLLAARGADVNAARHGVDHAHSQRHPNVQFDGGYHIRDNETAIKVDIPGSPISTLNDSQREGFTALASINLPLYTSGRIENSIFAADARLQATEHDRATYQRELKLSVAREYIAVLLAERELTVAIAAKKALAAHLHDVELMFQHERVPRNDLLAAEVAESNAYQSVFQKESQLEASRASYNRRLGRPLDTPVRLAELTLPDIPNDVESLTESALIHRHELRSLELQTESLIHQADAVLANTRPQVDLRGEYAFLENRFRSPEGISSIGIGVQWSGLDGGRSRTKAAELQQRAESLHRQRADYESRIRLDVRKAWLAVHESQRRIDATQQAVERAAENLRVVRSSYAVGTQTGTDVLDAVSLKTQAEQNHYSARYSKFYSILRLQNAMGAL